MIEAKTRIRKEPVRELIFADDAAPASHTESGLQSLVNSSADGCNDFGLNISLTKSEIQSQGDIQDPIISISEHRLETLASFTCLGRTVTSNLNLNTETSK